MERRYLPLEECPVSIETRDGSDSPRIIGRASVFYDGTEETEYTLFDAVRNDKGDVVEPALVERINAKAFNQVLRDKQDVRALFNHDPNMVLGRTSAGTLKLEKSLRGLDYNIEPPDTTAGRDTVESIRRKDVTGSSFSFTVARDGQRFFHDAERGVDVREIVRVSELFDVSVVVYPAYSSTSAQLRTAGSDLAEVRTHRQEWKDSVAEERKRALEAEEQERQKQERLAGYLARAEQVEVSCES